MLDAVQRSHDGSGVFIAPGTALGWSGPQADQRSAVIGTNECPSVRASSHSPISNAARLRADLGRSRHAFRALSHSELIARAYQEWGPRCVERLHGPFACAI